MSDDTDQEEQATDVSLDAEDLEDELVPDALVVDDDDLAVDDDLVVDDDLDDDLVDDAVIELDLAAEVLVDAPGPVVAKSDAAPPAKRADDEDDDVVDLDEELHPDDVETPLDALLEEKTAAAKMEDDEEDLEEEEPEGAELGDGPGRIVPRRPTEFHCSSCFLLLPRSQLADEERMLCRDCV